MTDRLAAFGSSRQEPAENMMKLEADLPAGADSELVVNAEKNYKIGENKCVC
jgi:hypothetical protein